MPACSDAPKLTVAVCTREPGVAIEQTFVGLRQQSLARDDFEVLVVDNGSSAAVAAGLVAACARHGFHYCAEPEAGLSRARNRAVAEARGDYLHFIDDDAVAPAHLLETLLACFEEEGCDVAGGPAHGLWREPPPAWLGPRYWPLLSLSNHGAQRRTLRYPEILLGCNVAFRRSCLTGATPFRLDLGRKGASLNGNEERELQQRLQAAGSRVVYEPAAYVFHAVGRERMQPEYFLRRLEAAAFANELMAPGSERRRHRWFSFALRQLLHVYHALRAALSFYWLESRMQCAAARGARRAQKAAIEP